MVTQNKQKHNNKSNQIDFRSLRIQSTGSGDRNATSGSRAAESDAAADSRWNTSTSTRRTVSSGNRRTASTGNRRTASPGNCRTASPDNYWTASSGYYRTTSPSVYSSTAAEKLRDYPGGTTRKQLIPLRRCKSSRRPKSFGNR